MTKTLVALLASAALVVGCNNAEERAADQREAAAEASATAAGDAIAALGMMEAQLLDADLLDPSNRELGEVEGVVRGGPNNAVDHLLVELEGSNPERIVQVPIADLAAVERGTDIDVSTTMTADQLAALPETPAAARPVHDR